MRDTDNEWRCDDASAEDSQDLVLNSPKKLKIGLKSAGNSQDCLCLGSRGVLWIVTWALWSIQDCCKKKQLLEENNVAMEINILSAA